MIDDTRKPFTIWLTDAEKEILLEKAEKDRRSLTGYIVKCALEKEGYIIKC